MVKKKATKKKVTTKAKKKVLTLPQRKKLLLKNLEASHNIVSMACAKSNLSRTTFYNYYEEDDAFAEAVDALADTAVDFVESKLYDLINSGDTTATIFYLKTKAKDRGYNERIDVNQHHTIEQIQIVPMLEEGQEYIDISPEPKKKKK